MNILNKLFCKLSKVYQSIINRFINVSFDQAVMLIEKETHMYEMWTRIWDEWKGWNNHDRFYSSYKIGLIEYYTYIFRSWGRRKDSFKKSQIIDFINSQREKQKISQEYHDLVDKYNINMDDVCFKKLSSLMTDNEVKARKLYNESRYLILHFRDDLKISSER